MALKRKLRDYRKYKQRVLSSGEMNGLLIQAAPVGPGKEGETEQLTVGNCKEIIEVAALFLNDAFFTRISELGK
jgi:hypothetical protein